jgi:uncharacterized Zn finger protein (UPF0148 family)
MALQGALVAGEPAHPGGPSTCRSCGAPLSVKPGKLCVPCYYCSTQNLVSLESSWVKQVKESADKKVKSLTQAINYFEDQNMVFKARKYTYTAVATVMLIIGGLITVKTDVAPIKEKSLEFLIEKNQLKSSIEGEVNLYLDLPINIIPGSKKTSIQYGYFQSENLEFYIAFAEKERLQVEMLKPDAELSLEAAFSKVTQTNRKRKKDKVQLLEKADLAAGKKVEFTANEKAYIAFLYTCQPKSNIRNNCS